MSSGRPDGHEHSIKMVESIVGILGAAMRQMSMFLGVLAMTSGSTSPKKRNSALVGS